MNVVDVDGQSMTDAKPQSSVDPDSPDVSVSPPCTQWMGLIQRQPAGEIGGILLEKWRQQTRHELGLATDRPILATGHQTLLWHPGILVKYMVAEAFAKRHQLAMANLIVDQHADGFGEFQIPIRKPDGSLGVRTLDLCRPKPRQDVPMGRHEAFTPPRVPDNLSGAIPSVNEGVRRIFDAVYAHRNAPNAALQMADALADLMSPWVKPMPNASATDLIGTALARAIMQEMVRDPWRCANCYNDAVASVPEAGIGQLAIRDEYVELPLWRIREDGRRMHAYDNDVEKFVSGAKSSVDLMPRALFMTALVRLGMCDLFIHGTGGAAYDVAMERWIRSWLGLEVGSIAVATATMRLPLMGNMVTVPNFRAALQEARHAWHDPMAADGRPSAAKRGMIAEIERAPRNSSERKAKFLAMHDQLQNWRHEQDAEVRSAQQRVEAMRRLASDLQIAMRRDWAFSLYPAAMLDRLNDRAQNLAQSPAEAGRVESMP
jgi:hypothetical protein